MIQIKTKLRKWGNSFGIVVPQKAVESEKVKEGEELTILIKRKSDLKRAFGALKNWKIDAQLVKDNIRKEEQENDKLLFRHLRND